MGGANFFIASINFELGPLKVAPCISMAGTFGGVDTTILAPHQLAGRRCPKTPPKIPAIHGATSGSPNSKSMKDLKRFAPAAPST